MAVTGQVISTAATMGLHYAERLLAEIPEDRFARMSAPSGKSIQSNHPAFIVGHLCLYPDKVAALLGSSQEKTQPPEKFEAVFSKTAQCVDDPDGTIYPKREEILAFFRQSYLAAIEAIAGASEEVLGRENPVDTPMKEVVDTLGGLVNFYMTSHVMVHLGQLSAWRRMENLPPA
ncbi:MAG TPA: hypothetical protein DDW52_24555 [Planctomycetaceae bacterium]|nr:hypothetical protein [Planctomycetaceae bacterium]